MDPREPSPEIRAKIEAWVARKAPGLTCCCGFKGHTHNIRQHRLKCPVWEAYCYRAKAWAQSVKDDARKEFEKEKGKKS